MKTLTAQEVKQKLQENPDTKLVMTLGPAAFDKCHIPGSLNVWDIKTAEALFPNDVEIIVYCSDRSCMASYYAYQQLERAGYENIWRFAGGLTEWDQNGFPLTS